MLLFRVAWSTTGYLDAEVRLFFQFLRLFSADPATVLPSTDVRIGSSKERNIASHVRLDRKYQCRSRRVLVPAADSPILGVRRNDILLCSTIEQLFWMLPRHALDKSN